MLNFKRVLVRYPATTVKREHDGTMQYRLYESDGVTMHYNCLGQWGEQTPKSGSSGHAIVPKVPVTQVAWDAEMQALRGRVDQAQDSSLSAVEKTIEATRSVEALRKYLDGAITEWTDKIDKAREVVVTVKLPEKDFTLPEHTHPQLPNMIRLAALKKPIYLKGPAGSGKSYAVEQLAQCMGLPMVRYGINPQTTKNDFFGFRNVVSGEYVRTPARECAEFGGVLFADEVDRGLGGMMTVLNTLADGGTITWPDGATFKPHKDFIIILAGNTFGSGADAIYVGANQLDGATLNRFAFIIWDYDWDMVAATCGNPAWARTVQRYSEAVGSLKVLISPRAAYHGADLIASGATQEEVADWYIWNAISADMRRTIEARA